MKQPQRGVRAPRLAEMIADVLRERILSGELADGDTLPKQDDLLEEFGVSRPSIREALRILETEGLVTVRRGNQGGAVVHPPRPDDAAYMLGLVLQAQDVGHADVASALHHLVPAAAAMCAELADRAELVEDLRDLHEQASGAVDDPSRFLELVQVFVERLAAGSRATTMRVIMAALVRIWASGETSVIARGQSGSASDRRARLRAQRRIVESIERGDARAAHRVALRHLERYPLYAVDGGSRHAVRAGTLRRANAA